MQNDPIEILSERTRRLEDQLNLFRGGAIVLVACSLAFIGIEYSRIPSAVHDAIRERIGETTLQSITDAKGISEALIKQSRENQSWDPQMKRGYVVVGNMLICFGTEDATSTPRQHVRDFKFAFPRPFASPPTVNITCIADGSGSMFAIYSNFEPTQQDCKGTMAVTSGTESPGPIRSLKVTYVAIGPIAK